MTGLVTTDVEPWACNLPGVGRCFVHSDGSTSFELANGVDSSTASMLKERVISPLSWWRRGHWLLNGAVMVSPAQQAVLLCAQPDLTERLVVALSQRGWTCVGDSLVPAAIADGSVLVQRRVDTVLCSSTLAMSESLHIVEHPRPGGNAVTVRVPMHEGSVALGATALFPLAPSASESAGLARARLARGSLVEVSPGERTPEQVLDAVSGLTALPLWTRADPNLAEIADGPVASDRAVDRAVVIRTRLGAALDDLSEWLGDLAV